MFLIAEKFKISEYLYYCLGNPLKKTAFVSCRVFLIFCSKWSEMICKSLRYQLRALK